MTSLLMNKKGLKNKRVKSFAGCFSCKKKKKKCDEGRPVCLRCKRSGVACEWPELLIEHRRSSSKIFDNDFQETEFISNTSLRSIGAGLSEQPLEMSDVSTCITEFTSGKCHDIEEYCYGFFEKKFLPSLSHPFTLNFRLEIASKEEAKKSKALKQIFVACGAAMLAFEDASFKEISYIMYKDAISCLIEEIRDCDLSGSEDWLLMAVQTLQTLCFREGYIGLPGITVAPHFCAAFQIICKRFLDRSYEMQEGNEHGCESEVVPVLTSIERFSIENFLFNYPISIFFGRYKWLENTVPNPSYVFNLDALWQAFDGMGRDSIDWFSKMSFEIAAKSAWILRLKLPLNQEDRQTCLSMYVYSRRILNDFIESRTTSMDAKREESISIAIITLRVSLIILRKMLSLKYLTAKNFQSDINSIIKEMKKHENLILPGWTLLVGYCVSIEIDQRSFFRNSFSQLSSQLHSNMLSQIISFVDLISNESSFEYAFDKLFDTEVLDTICMR